MCFSREASAFAFMVGIISSTTLIKYGNPEYKIKNKIWAYFFVFISLMQLIEYLIWSDTSCTNGLNKLASYTGPLLNHLQPVILPILSKIMLPSTKNTSLVDGVNLIYVVYVLNHYFNFIKSGNLCNKTCSNGHIIWNWSKDFDYTIYHMMSFLNAITYMGDSVSIATMLVGYIMLYLSIKYYHTNPGEMWCFFAVSVPMFTLGFQKI